MGSVMDQPRPWEREYNEPFDKQIEQDMSKVLAEATNVINKERTDMPRDYVTGQTAEPRPSPDDTSRRVFGYGIENIELVRQQLQTAYNELTYWQARVSDLEHNERVLERLINDVNPDVPRPTDASTGGAYVNQTKRAAF